MLSMRLTTTSKETIMDKEEVKEIREKYPKGAIVRLIHMDDHIHPVPDGTIGVVDYVDDAGQIHMRWETGSGLALVPDVDEFKRIL